MIGYSLLDGLISFSFLVKLGEKREREESDTFCDQTYCLKNYGS